MAYPTRRLIAILVLEENGHQHPSPFEHEKCQHLRWEARSTLKKRECQKHGNRLIDYRIIGRYKYTKPFIRSGDQRRFVHSKG
jgi:hypothetical protein